VSGCCLQVRGRWQLSPAEGGPRPLKVTVRRAELLEDAYRGLAAAGCNIKARLQVGRAEAAVMSRISALLAPQAATWLTVMKAIQPTSWLQPSFHTFENSSADAFQSCCQAPVCEMCF
jgi:hypothetical protein